MRIALCITTLILFTANAANCQNRDGARFIDSVLTDLPRIENDTEKFNVYAALSEAYNDINLDSSLYYARKAMALTSKMNWGEGIMLADQNLAWVLNLRSKYDSALYYFDKALKRARKNNDSLMVGYCYNNMASVYVNSNQYSMGLKYYLNALEIYEANGVDDIATLYSDIGDLYNGVGEPAKANEYYQKALVANKKYGDRFDRAYIMMSLVSQLIEAKEYDEALVYSDSIIQIYSEYDNKFFIALGRYYKAACLREKGDYNKAMKLSVIAGKYFEEASDELYTHTANIEIARTYILAVEDSTGYKLDISLFEPTKGGNYAKAIVLLNSARSFFEETGDQSSLIDIYDLLSRAYEATGEMKTSLEFYKLRSALKDSADIQNESKKVAKLDAKKEMELKNKELELQKLIVAKKRNERVYLIGGIVLMLIVLGIVYRSYRQRGVSNKLLAEEKHKSEELLLNILPEEVAEELKEKGTADATHFDEVTVLFTDFVNFSKASERMSSQELVDELHACFKAFDEIVSKYHIEKIKTIGDAYLAVSGLPVIDRKHAEHVVSAAIEILQFMQERRARLGDKTFEIRIGLHSGDVVAGIVGVKKFAYDIWGDTVNTAARMEQNSEPGKINISQTTYELVKDRFACTYRGEHEAKNKGKLKMYFVEVKKISKEV